MSSHLAIITPNMGDVSKCYAWPVVELLELAGDDARVGRPCDTLPDAAVKHAIEKNKQPFVCLNHFRTGDDFAGAVQTLDRDYSGLAAAHFAKQCFWPVHANLSMSQP